MINLQASLILGDAIIVNRLTLQCLDFSAECVRVLDILGITISESFLPQEELDRKLQQRQVHTVSN